MGTLPPSPIQTDAAPLPRPFGPFAGATFDADDFFGFEAGRPSAAAGCNAAATFAAEPKDSFDFEEAFTAADGRPFVFAAVAIDGVLP